MSWSLRLLNESPTTMDAAILTEEEAYDAISGNSYNARSAPESGVALLADPDDQIPLRVRKEPRGGPSTHDLKQEFAYAPVARRNCQRSAGIA
ncbi:MAG: hypothetical protein AW10_00995 [Candidatus Accumulibacter appositus]|uniref:Uncharacterized protein n=1 Tax=Candidatus Accumulibacter appositus TaxID=1454003 RepID=A0A011NG54_9PROT|nr:MAG: hypothetical protein AW10_00995 [Candidatus Accumulibacter appositus]